ncbi:hypothetical protein LIPSTDRAFT_70052 [Lipomyces starkeyi NRRL Y-11557]|uniref:Uncharacterized protein n=1 Tax=Lipomyces starkeyi NRRL Y-11557 TaxID=675824 RepID=A0A1E3Q9V9_LIPST|nr:hypothetical protein LIPSTDRAFT_70052 [Lipomyces starkeyi NRRL Y-11557]
MSLFSTPVAGFVIDDEAPVLPTSSSFSSLASGYDGAFDNMLSSGGNTSQSSLVSAGQQAQFFSLLSSPPILVGLVENIGVNDLKSLRLVHSYANHIIAGSSIYHKFLKQLAISCSEATFACRWASQKSTCFQCGADVCTVSRRRKSKLLQILTMCRVAYQELPHRRRILSGLDACVISAGLH